METDLGKSVTKAVRRTKPGAPLRRLGRLVPFSTRDLTSARIFVPAIPSCTTMLAETTSSPATPMSSTRQHVKLDEQAFQNLLAAAYTIQEHNAQRSQGGGTQALAQELTRHLAEELTQQLTQKFCPQCGAPLSAGATGCDKCAKKEPQPATGPAQQEELRPGERMQQKWASLWHMTQDKGFWPRRPSLDESGEGDHTTDAEGPIPKFAEAPKANPAFEEEPVFPSDRASRLEHASSHGEALVPAGERSVQSEPILLEEPVEVEASRSPNPNHPREWDLHLTLRFQRADLYLVLAILVAVIAMVWVVSASPSASNARAHAVQLSFWERTLVSMGLAEAPAAPVYAGNPSVQVWVDPHTALYYCPGEEEFGKTTGGHYSSQRQAQMDQFEPSGRSACE